MNENEVKQLRYQSALYERLCEAVATLNDEELASLVVADVKLARGKKDAHVFIDATDIPASDRPRLVRKLERASGYLSKYILAAEGWFKAPELHFKMDDTIKQANRLDEIFDKIRKDQA
ncbi:MAG: 30S ribosome-binding factor RbfA [Campylobacterales bacterium]